jgi:hypothetical protein
MNGSDSIANGILLRVDLHKLFDLGLLAIDPGSGRISLAGACSEDYGNLFGKCIFTPPPGGPPLKKFEARWEDHLKLKASSGGVA